MHWVCFINFFDVGINIGLSLVLLNYNQFMGILLFIQLTNNFSLIWCDLFLFAVTLTLWNVTIDRKSYITNCIKHITNWFNSQKYCLKRNKHFITSNIESNIAYYYTLYTSVYLIGKIRIFYLVTTFHFLIFTSIIYG